MSEKYICKGYDVCAIKNCEHKKPHDFKSVCILYDSKQHSNNQTCKCALIENSHTCDPFCRLDICINSSQNGNVDKKHNEFIEKILKRKKENILEFLETGLKEAYWEGFHDGEIYIKNYLKEKGK